MEAERAPLWVRWEPTMTAEGVEAEEEAAALAGETEKPRALQRTNLMALRVQSPEQACYSGLSSTNPTTDQKENGEEWPVG
ncbi:MAG: hypothetical protein VKN33_01840 [Candidatus Sericytochromatia bacterium]|nr:hypothetical protein [Candidatus Sericytochromatia bacterium]